MMALKGLMLTNTIDTERQPNSENHLYLKLMEKAKEHIDLSFIKMANSKVYNLIITDKPEHLKKKS